MGRLQFDVSFSDCVSVRDYFIVLYQIRGSILVIRIDDEIEIKFELFTSRIGIDLSRWNYNVIWLICNRNLNTNTSARSNFVMRYTAICSLYFQPADKCLLFEIKIFLRCYSVCVWWMLLRSLPAFAEFAWRFYWIKTSVIKMICWT